MILECDNKSDYVYLGQLLYIYMINSFTYSIEE